jgi:putative spermidine/putrescine transport system substrate-binding protein
MARKLGKHTVALTAAIAAAGLAIGTASAQPKMVQKLGKGEGRVDIVAWPGYIERGATDKNFDWVTEFEKKTGCKVNVKTAGTSDEMVALMNEGGFDLVTASGDASSPASGCSRSTCRWCRRTRRSTRGCRRPPGTT